MSIFNKDQNKIMLIENKYKKWYDLIIKNARNKVPNTAYTEMHHIIPKSLGGKNNKENLVRLTAREHFICHLLLVKFTTGQDQIKMRHAVGKFIQQNKFQNRKFNSWEYKKIRENLSKSRKGMKRSKEVCEKISKGLQGNIPWNKGKKTGPHSKESNIKRSNTLKGKSFEERFGVDRAKEIRLKISESKKGHTSGMTGKRHSEETKRQQSISISNSMTEEVRKKISNSRLGMKFSEEHLKNLTKVNKENGLKRRGMKQEKIRCPHCGKIGGMSGMKRYHFDNCKIK